MKNPNGAAVGLIVIISMLLAIPLSILACYYNGWALATLWGWFVVPAFDVRYLTICQAAGIMLVVHMCLSPVLSVLSNKQSNSSLATVPIFVGVFGPILTVGVGWLLHWSFRLFS